MLIFFSPIPNPDYRLQLEIFRNKLPEIAAIEK